MPEWSELLRARLASLRLDPAREAEILEELSQHLDQRRDELRRDGLADEAARRAAVAELDADALADWMRPLRQANVPPPVTPGTPRRSRLRDFRQDVRYAWRMLRKERGLTAAALLTLALGIGANGAIFALVDAVLLRPLPFPAPERLVMLWETTASSDRESVSPLNLIDWRDGSRAFENIAGFAPNVGGMVMAGADGTPEPVARQWSSAGIFDVLGVKPVAGRTFLRADDEQEGEVVVLSESFWRARFGGDSGVVGKSLRLDGEPWTVVGVVPDEAQIIGRADMWALIPIEGAPAEARGSHFFRAIGRLRAGATPESARAELDAISARLARDYPDTNAGRGVAIETLREAVIGGDLRRTSILFLGVVVFVLLICCANVANLLMTRSTRRARELAIRTSLGADRTRIIRQLLTESLLLSAIGGAAGIAIGALTLVLAPRLLPEEILPPTVTLAFDLRVVAFCALAALLVGCFFGLAPAWQAKDLSPASVLAGSSRTTTGRGGRVRAALVGAQVATAVILLFGAGLLLRTLLAVEGVERGYRARGVLTLLVDPHGRYYPNDGTLLRFYDEVAESVEAIPGVRAAAWATTLPLGRSYQGQTPFEIEGDAPLPEPQRPTADYQIVSDGYFRALDLPIVAGRAFDARDRAGSLPVAIVNEAFVRKHLRGRSPAGSRISIVSAQTGETEVREIVGVARQVKARPNETEDLIQVYVPLAQDTAGDVFLMVRPSRGSATPLAPSVREAIATIDREQIVGVRDVRTLDEIVWEATARHRMRAALVTAFAGLALLLAMIGVFGVIAYSVQQRVRDFGVRRALGATTGDLVRLVASSAARLVGTGAIIGLAVSAVVGRLLSSMLFGVAPLDLVTFAGVAAVIAVTAVVSTAGPAWRATLVDPAVALRDD
ncbi:MAG TPA: ABC transporter permease [Thermoanaerobaculia bacterium]|nr:ABC transporter permease [Thermoanaerobaculia bacterium]